MVKTEKYLQQVLVINYPSLLAKVMQLTDLQHIN